MKRQPIRYPLLCFVLLLCAAANPGSRPAAAAPFCGSSGGKENANERGFDCSPLQLNDDLNDALAQQGQAPAADSTSKPESAQAAGAAETENLAKQAQNPIASLISLPVQWNSTPGSQWAPREIDPSARHNRTFNVVNVQPVVPFKLNDNLTLVGRFIVPVIQRPLEGATDVIGIGDMNPSLFLVPRPTGSLMVGFGPTMKLPTATNDQLGDGRWSAGPTAVAVYTKGPWVAGTLINNVWSFAGGGPRDVNRMLIQPFLSYNMPGGWYLTSSPIITSDWTIPGGRGWTVPIGGGVGRVFRLGDQPINASLQAFWNVVKPELLGDELPGDLTIRLQVQALFPTGR
jgi:hypothetical protein